MKPAAHEGNESYIFISYAHKDSDRVFPIVNELSGRGYRIWYDDGIAPGSEWPENIAQHLNAAGMVMAFLSPNAVASPHCRREINFALSKRKPFLSVVLEKTEMPLGMEMQLSAQQSILRYSYPDWNEFIGKILKCPAIEPCRSETAEAAPEAEPDGDSPVCPSCGSRQLRKEADGALVCDYCGSRIFPREEKPNANPAEIDAKLIAIYNEAAKYKIDKDYVKELSTLLEGLSLTTSSDLLMLKIGRSYRRNGVSKKAMEYYEKARALNPNNPLVYNSIGVLYQDAGHPSNAIPYYEKSIEIMRRDPLSATKADLANDYDNLAWCYGKTGKTEEAVKYLRLAKENGYSVETLKSDCEKLNIPPEAVLGGTPEDLNAILAQAEDYQKKDEYSKELPVLLRAYAIAPENTTVLLRLGRVHRRLKNYQKAMEYYERAKELDPKDPTLYTNLGSLYHHMGEFAQARENQEKAIRMMEADPKSVTQQDWAVTYANYGWTLGKLGDMAGARKNLRIAKDKGYSLDSIKFICEQINLPLRKITGWF